VRLLARASRFSRPLGWVALGDWAVEWGVAGLSRMLFTLMQEDITSKDDALRFMLDAAPGEYHGILERLCSSGQGMVDGATTRSSSAAGRCLVSWNM